MTSFARTGRWGSQAAPCCSLCPVQWWSTARLPLVPGDAWVCCEHLVLHVSYSLCVHVSFQSTEQQPVTSVKSDKNVPSSQEPQAAKQNIKAPEPAAPLQAAATEAPKEVPKEKAASTPTPLSKLFWKKVRLDFGAGPSHSSVPHGVWSYC